MNAYKNLAISGETQYTIDAKAFNYLCIKNNTSGNVVVAFTSGKSSTDEDAWLIKSGEVEIVTIPNDATKAYINGTGNVQTYLATAQGECPFKSASAGGSGGSVEIYLPGIDYGGNFAVNENTRCLVYVSGLYNVSIPYSNIVELVDLNTKEISATLTSNTSAGNERWLLQTKNADGDICLSDTVKSQVSDWYKIGTDVTKISPIATSIPIVNNTVIGNLKDENAYFIAGYQFTQAVKLFAVACYITTYSEYPYIVYSDDGVNWGDADLCLAKPISSYNYSGIWTIPSPDAHEYWGVKYKGENIAKISATSISLCGIKFYGR